MTQYLTTEADTEAEVEKEPTDVHITNQSVFLRPHVERWGSHVIGYRSIRKNTKGTYTAIGGIRYPVREYTEYEHRSAWSKPWILVGEYGDYHFGAPFSPTYEELRKAYDAVAPWRGKEAFGERRPLRTARTKAYAFRVNRDESIDLFYWGDKMITFYPDGRLWVNRPRYVGEATFIRDYTPISFSVYKVYDGILAFTTKVSDPKPDTRWGYAPWSRGNEALLMQIGSGGAVFQIDGNIVECVDKGDCEPFQTIVNDTAATRALCKEYRIHDFKCWVKAVSALDGNHGTLLEAYLHEDIPTALRLASEGDFPEAARYLPRVTDMCYGYAGWRPEYRISTGSVERLREHLYRDNADRLFTVEPQDFVTMGEYETMRRKQRYAGTT